MNWRNLDTPAAEAAADERDDIGAFEAARGRAFNAAEELFMLLDDMGGEGYRDHAQMALIADMLYPLLVKARAIKARGF